MLRQVKFQMAPFEVFLNLTYALYFFDLLEDEKTSSITGYLFMRSL